MECITWRAWHDQNRDHCKRYDRERYAGERRAKQVKVATEWVKANRARYRENAKSSYRRHRKKRLAVIAQLQRLRRVATPKWASATAMRAIYEACPAGYHVDHIIPLRGKTVCGLHCESNLRIIPAAENLSKGNRLIPEL